MALYNGFMPYCLRCETLRLRVPWVLHHHPVQRTIGQVVYGVVGSQLCRPMSLV